MPDLGDITIIEKPLIIREAKVGGRKLTKALYLQLPSEEDYPTCREGVRIVAWLESHWKDCDDEQINWSECGRTHRHVLLGGEISLYAVRCSGHSRQARPSNWMVMGQRRFALS